MPWHWPHSGNFAIIAARCGEPWQFRQSGIVLWFPSWQKAHDKDVCFAVLALSTDWTFLWHAPQLFDMVSAVTLIFFGM